MALSFHLPPPPPHTHTLSLTPEHGLPLCGAHDGVVYVTRGALSYCLLCPSSGFMFYCLGQYMGYVYFVFNPLPLSFFIQYL